MTHPATHPATHPTTNPMTYAPLKALGLASLLTLALVSVAQARPDPDALLLDAVYTTEPAQVPAIWLDPAASQMACVIPLNDDAPKIVLSQAGNLHLTSCPIPN